MRRVVIPKSGSADVLDYRKFNNLERLVPGSIRVKVSYSGVNFADIMMRLGLYPDAPALPFTPGYEFSGEIVEVGPEVTDFQIGDLVLGGTCFGGYASEVIVDSSLVVPLGTYSLKEGAALPVSFLTSYLVFFELGRVRFGDKILIDCATGALGQMSFQLLKPLNVSIVGLTSSLDKKKMLEDLGVKAMTHDEYRNSSEGGFNLILNSRGGVTIKKDYLRLAPLGKVICVGASGFFTNGKKSWFKVIKEFLLMPKFNSINLMNDNKGALGLNVLKLFEEPAVLVNLLHKLEDFEIKPRIDKVFKAEDVTLAHRYIEQKKSRGKVLLKWN